jgi:hypothetical protein
MKEGAWIEASSGDWHWIDDHADWIRRPANARMVGLPEEAVLRIAAMPRKHRSGAERNAILIAAMSEGGLIRFRGHGTCVTFEATVAIGAAVQAAAKFMETYLGPLTHVCFNKLPAGPSVGIPYQDLKPLLKAGDITPLLGGLPASSQPPKSSGTNTKGTNP